MLKKFKALFVEEEGQGMVEYGLILGAIAVVVIVVLFSMGEKIGAFFTDLTGKIPG